MSEEYFGVFLSADSVLPRMVGILGDSELISRVKPLEVRKYKDCRRPLNLFGPVTRPVFEIAESELPY